MLSAAPDRAGDVVELGDGLLRVVALHGIQGTRDSWVPVATRLADAARWVLPNLRGRGAAPRGRGTADYALDPYAGDVRAVVARHVPPGVPWVLAGWSMGVSVALQYLIRDAGPRPAGLLLLSGTPALCEAPWFKASEPGALLAEISAREEALGLRVAADREAVAATWTAIRATDQRPHLKDISIPALVIHGRQDADSPWAHAVQLAQSLPAARLLTLEDGGHGIPSSHADPIAAVARGFFTELKRDIP
ncbi:alpha/beta fold hydrolase [Comamonas badia]|uniref:alpha/beta fold hydrolase n=1 Tax=Comamonas badia TaxID=265291 RepID=UPI0004289FA3|nr:alpha/beta hydrolase [Comamonas badia]